MNVEFTRAFDTQFSQLPSDLQRKGRRTIEVFIECSVTRRFPKGLRVHKCGPFLSLSVTMNYRIFVFPISGGIRFVFVGDHRAAERYLKDT